MQRLGVPVSYSTDAPISPMNPLLNLEWAVLRQDSSDPFSACFCPDEKVDVYSAFEAYTANSAFSSFDECSLGRIKEGYLADLVFLDKDIFTIPPEDIHKTKVLRTMSAGETVYVT
jgi:predicted amidohydrolase YtcJ